MKFEDLRTKIYKFNYWWEELEDDIIDLTFPAMQFFLFGLLIIWALLLLYQFVRLLI